MQRLAKYHQVKNQIVLYVWYDNEYGYGTRQVIRFKEKAKYLKERFRDYLK
jgi:glyceraldehyde-3-phosphate dehydrogenase/erythrose-4-phosphate dehydrogenase